VGGGTSLPAFAGYPILTVPAGYESGRRPFGLTFTGRAYSEPTLLKLAYAYEQATHHRRPPQFHPNLEGDE
jgi:amidase